MDFTLFAYEISPNSTTPYIYFEETLEACRQTAMEQRQELAGEEDTDGSIGRITIYECHMRMPTQVDIMAALNAQDDQSVLFNAVVVHRKVIELI